MSASEMERLRAENERLQGEVEQAERETAAESKRAHDLVGRLAAAEEKNPPLKDALRSAVDGLAAFRKEMGQITRRDGDLLSAVLFRMDVWLSAMEGNLRDALPPESQPAPEPAVTGTTSDNRTRPSTEAELKLLRENTRQAQEIATLTQQRDTEWARRKEATAERIRAEEKNTPLVEALGIGTPWPLRDVLKRLADAATHLLRDHDCDTHGHEGIRDARDAALRIIAALSMKSEGTATPATAEGGTQKGSGR